MPPDLPRSRKSVSIYSRTAPVSPNNINTLSLEKVRRINEIVAKRKMSQSFIKFSKPVVKENVWRSVLRICMWILGCKGLRASARGLSCCSCKLCLKLLPEKTAAGKALECRAGGCGFNSWGWTNTQGLKITEK